MLFLTPDREPTLLVPTLERPDAEGAEGARSLTLVDWPDGADPYAAASALLRPDATYGVSDSAWAMHLLGLQDAVPGLALPLADPEPADAAGGQGRQRAGPARGGRRRRGRDVRRDPRGALLRTQGDRRRRPTWPTAARASATSRSTSRSSAPARTAPTRTTRPATGSIEVGDAVVLDFGGLMFGYGSDTSRTVCVGEPTAEIREVHEIVREAQQAGVDAVRPGRRLPGDRPGRAAGHHRRGVRRAVHPPHRPRHRRRRPTSRRT